ncbi:MAG: GNAT family N-acetyltransferase [Pigmentiphaga sp.]|uniref:bifunctional acetate--CoA ligase family protein/GNAT family N-acetyltransferase n=1 Tax=Pigmentiphaga sp. TaxID=1977564 RepID=UPI0029BF28B5|nr:GNAT family N-acetyltransferase [Pigmentiphaga sp.]MDX3906645.1 GNAT family N-acetyltransferase [Pigmentiphaga sp.]
MSRHALSPLFDPRSVIAISDRTLPLMAALPAALRARTTEIRLDQRLSYRLPAALAQATGRPDLAVIGVPRTALRATLETLAPARPQAVAVLTHEPSLEDTEFCRDWAARHDCILLGPHSFGLQRPHAGLNASVHPQLGRAGRVALVTQSRSIMAVVMDWADDNRTGFSTVVSLGAEAALDIPRVLDFLVADARTDSIALYLEDVRDAREFMSAIRAAASVKPVVVLKAGHTGRARTSVRPLGAAAGDAVDAAPPGPSPVAPDTVFDAALRRAGAVRVRYFVQLFSAVKALSFTKLPSGRRIAVLANGSGPAQLALDLLGPGRAVMRAELAEATRGELAATLSSNAWTDNPVVEFSPPDPQACAQAVRTIAADPGVDGLLAVFSPDPEADMRAVAQALAQAAPAAPKLVITCFMGDAAMRPLRRILDDAGSPAFRTPEAAVDAFGNLATYHYNQQLLLQTPPPEPPGQEPDLGGARILIDSARQDGRLTLTEPESKALLAAFHIPVVQVILARTPAEAVIAAQQIGFPVAIKIDSPDVARKSAVRGVHLDIRNSTELVTAYHRMLANAQAAAPQARIAGITVEAMAGPPGSAKVSMGVARDALFGPVIRFGPSHSRGEGPGNRSVELPPLNGFLARRLMERSPIWRYVLAAQISPRAVDMLEDMLVRISEIVCALPDIESLDIDPVMIDGDRVVATDTRITMTREPAREADPGLGGYAHMAIHPYPARLVRHLQFKDGSPYVIRPIRPEDAVPLQDFTRQLSEHTRYMRFISFMRELSPRTLARYTQVDYHRELALVATVWEADPEHAGELREVIIGVARYLLNADGESAEYALVIGDAWQRRGLGLQLMTALVDAARKQGLKIIEGVVLGTNRPMLTLMGRLGFRIDKDDEDPSMRRVWLRLDQEPGATATSG